MGIFSKRSSNDSGSDFDFSEFDYIEDENLSSSSIPDMNYDEFNKEIDDDDPLGIDRKPPEKNNDDKGGNSFGKIIISLTIIAVIAMGLFYVSENSDTTGDENTQSQSQEDTKVEDNNDEDDSSGGLVAPEEVNKEYSTSSNGNPTNGTGAIMAFDYAYYVLRDGDAVRKTFNPDVDAYEGSYIQREIDKVPQGVKHKLSITPKIIGESYDVVLTLSIPGSDPVSYKQKFSTMEKDGKFYVKTFESFTDDDNAVE